MDINFYQMTNDKRVISKTLGTARAKSGCQLIEPCDILKPSFTIDVDTTLYSYNYVYISYFGRYYYVDNITILDGARMLVTCSVDVLMSFNAQIKECTINTRRNENNYDMYLPDDRPVESRAIRYSVKFPHSFDQESSSYVLITVGNGDTNLV